MLIKKNITPVLVVFILLFVFTTIACSTSSIPFLTSSPKTPPTEEISPNSFQTMVAISVDQKVSQTLEAMPSTNILAPSPIPSPTKTEPLPSPTTTKATYPEMGSDLIKNADGSLTFFDSVIQATTYGSG